MTSVIDLHAPLVTRHRGRKLSHPWFNEHTQELRRRRRALERKWKDTGLEIDKEIYEAITHSIKKHIREAKIKHYNHALSNADSKSTFRIMNSLMKNTEMKLPISDSDDDLCSMFSEFFEEKINQIMKVIHDRVSSEAIVPPVLPSPAVASKALTEYKLTDESELQKIILNSPSKSCSLDPLPTWLLKQMLPAILPSLCILVNTSISSGVFPQALKTAIVSPLLKKPSLDQNVLKNYRPVSNLAFVGKLTEKLVLKRINNHMTSHGLHDELQSAYRANHSTESALMKVQHDIVKAVDSNKAVMLVLLDLSAAFDTINIENLLLTLKSRVNIQGTALSWLRSYLVGRTQSIRVRNANSAKKLLRQGVPQGSVLGPVMFTIYTLPIADICRKHAVKYHRFADDTQLYIEYDPNVPGDMERAKQQLINCIQEIRAWMLANDLKLNDDKTDFLVVLSPHHLRQFSCPDILLSGHTFSTSTAVKNLGCYFDRHMNLDRLISSYCSTAYYHLRNISRVSHYLSREACHAAVRSLVLSRLDFSNGLLGGLNHGQVARLQLVQNSAARLIFHIRKRDHITLFLKQLHWLPIQMRIRFKLCTYMYKAIHNLGPSYY